MDELLCCPYCENELLHEDIEDECGVTISDEYECDYCGEIIGVSYVLVPHYSLTRRTD